MVNLRMTPGEKAMDIRENQAAPLKIAVLGHKTIPSRQGGIEIVVEELTVRMAEQGHQITVYNRSGHPVSGREFDAEKLEMYKGVRMKYVPTIDKKGTGGNECLLLCGCFGGVWKVRRGAFPCGGFLHNAVAS